MCPELRGFARGGGIHVSAYTYRDSVVCSAGRADLGSLWRPDIRVADGGHRNRRGVRVAMAGQTLTAYTCV